MKKLKHESKDEMDGTYLYPVPNHVQVRGSTQKTKCHSELEFEGDRATRSAGSSASNQGQGIVGEATGRGTRILGLAPLAELEEVFPGQSELSVEQFVGPGLHKAPRSLSIPVYSGLLCLDTYFLKSQSLKVISAMKEN